MKKRNKLDGKLHSQLLMFSVTMRLSARIVFTRAGLSFHHMPGVSNCN